MRRLTIYLAVATFTLAAGSVFAQNAITGGSIEVHSTFHNAGVNVTYTGDDNANATALLEIDAGSGFAQVHPLSRMGTDRFTGSAFFLGEGTSYDVRVTLSDPDGATNETLTASGQTRSLTIPTSNGNTFHVAEGGSDSGTGTNEDPFETIAHAIGQCFAGDTVLIHAGTYHEEVNITSGGTEAAPITIAAAGDGDAILSGAHPSLLQSSAWSDSGSNVYSAAVSQTRYVAVDDVRMWRYESMADLQSLSEGTDGGFFFDGSQVHVRLPGDAAPSGHTIEVSTLGRAFWIEGAPNIVIRGLTIRGYGGVQYAEGIMVRDGSHGVWIAENQFEHVMPGVWVKNDVDDLTILDNRFSDRGLAEFPWSAVKAQGGMESGAMTVDSEYNGQGIVFTGNVVHDSFDGMNICGNEPMIHPNNADVYANTFYHLGDDGIETDGECSNIRIMLNRFEDTLVGVSVAPAVGGPTYVIRNLMVDLKNVGAGSDWMTRAMKFNVSDPRISGDIFAYHNTGVTYEPDQPAWGVTDDSEWTQVRLLNNIWVGTDHAFYHVNSGDEPFSQDYDLLFSTGDRLVYHQGSHYDTISDYFTATSLCENCVSSQPLFTDAAGGDYSLQTQSPAVDVGVVIPGVNEDYADNGPDLGAHELGGIGPDADADADTDADTDSDTDADTDTDAGTDNSKSSDGCGCVEGGAGTHNHGLMLLLGALL